VQENAPRHAQLRLDRCLWCNEPLPDGRYDRKTHDNCRNKIYKWKRHAKRYAGDCIKRLNSIEQRLNFEFSFQDAIAALHDIQSEINEIYKRHNIVRVK